MANLFLAVVIATALVVMIIWSESMFLDVFLGICLVAVTILVYGSWTSFKQWWRLR